MLIFTSLIFVMLLGSSYSYLEQTQKPKSTSAKKNVSANTSSRQEIETGKQLISKTDCLVCHKPKDKLVGPSFADIAKKYPPSVKNFSLLSQKVIKGGSGVWGQIPMAPHPALAVADVKKMLKYILSQ